ncbi:hypothetical protein [Candidatus Oscillochloris fontis]|uniref:hypothetical protein n=1 Tax=Candidatus Oscillochloris fontis TaxID=2496868 RepID=UPI00101C47C6|nr:hypothetical protein [Candidatus Oscillochloris fontis]
MTLPDWLPPMLDLSGDWNDILHQLYTVFTRDFKTGSLFLAGEPIWHDRRILPGEAYEESFWHLVTRKDNKSGDRLPDFRRAERLPWCAPILRNINDPAIKFWHYREGNQRLRMYAWLEAGDYVVILEHKPKRIGQVAFLITAYHLDGESMRRSMRKRYERREL